MKDYVSSITSEGILQTHARVNCLFSCSMIVPGSCVESALEIARLTSFRALVASDTASNPASDLLGIRLQVTNGEGSIFEGCAIVKLL